MNRPLLSLEDLSVTFASPGGDVPAVRELSLGLGAGEALGVVGESGCGKSATAAAVLGLLGPAGRVSGGSAWFGGRDLARLPGAELRAVRGREIGMVFQDPMTSLNPVFTVGYQLAEALGAGGRLPRAEVRRRCRDLLSRMGVPEAEARLDAYPGELSGGLRQRAMIAMATARRPRLLIADEPTTALDVTVQAQIMELLAELRRDTGMALLLITHDLGLVAQHVDRVVVMYAGRAVEEAPTRGLFARPLHPYTRGLLGSLPAAAGTVRGGRLRAIPGVVPDPRRLPGGCPFRDRCAEALDACGKGVPPYEEKEPGRRVRCLRVGRHG